MLTPFCAKRQSLVRFEHFAMAASINPFDAAIYIFLLIAGVFGFNTGLLRSLATIFRYVAAMGVVLAAAPPRAQR